MAILQGKLTHSVPPWPHTRMKTPPRASHVGLGYMGWESTPKTSSIYLFGVGVAVPSYPIHVDELYSIFTFRVAMAHGIIGGVHASAHVSEVIGVWGA